MLCFLCLPACNSGTDSVESLLEFMQEEDIVDDNLILIEKMSKINAGIIPSSKSYHVYENESSELIVINYDTNVYAKNDYDFLISVYYDVSVNEDITYSDDISSEVFYSYSDGTKSKDCKYNLENKAEYAVYETKPLFSKTKYKFEII